MKKTYTVHAESTTDYTIEIEAESREEAMEIASGMDGGDFIENGLGSWDITDATENE